ncbi:MAG TPA: hypothetical protein VEV83_15435 [Parafilimonas sp.]|nr:hypothetical protein [Parafilimonas sp.]
MSTQTRDYPEDIIYNFLKSKYVAYRSSLSDPNVLPADTDILWGEPKSELKVYSFVVTRDTTTRLLPYLGISKVQYSALCTARFAITWIGPGKPPYLNEWEEFIDYHIAKYQTDTYFKSRGIESVKPSASGITEPREPEVDQWVLSFQIIATYMKSFT